MRDLSIKEKWFLFVIDCMGKAIRWVNTVFKGMNIEQCKENVRNILFLEPWGIGDIVIASYFLPGLRKCFPLSKITVLCSNAAAELLEGCPFVDEVVAYNFPWTKTGNKYSLRKYNWQEFFSLVRYMKKKNIDVAITGRPDPRYNLLLWLFGSKCRIGFGTRGGGFFLTHELGKREEYQHHTGRWKAAIRVTSCNPNISKHGFWLSENEVKIAEGIMLEAGVSNGDTIIGIHTGASYFLRRWPLEDFYEVAKKISKNNNIKVLVFTDPNGPNIKFTDNDFVILPRVNLRILAALLRKFDIFLCNDSGPMHIADAVGIPVVALCGSGSLPSEFGPIGSHHTIIEAKVDCRPCYVRCKYSEPICWPTITVSEVVSALNIKIEKLQKTNKLEM